MIAKEDEPRRAYKSQGKQRKQHLQPQARFPNKTRPSRRWLRRCFFHKKKKPFPEENGFVKGTKA